MNSPVKLFRRRGNDSLPMTGSGAPETPANGQSTSLVADGHYGQQQQGYYYNSNQGGDNANRGPIAGPRAAASPFRRFFFGSGSHSLPTPDGSARSIRLNKPIWQVWKESSGGTKATYISIVIFIFMLYYGIRMIRYNNAYIHLTCRAADCTLTINPRGWGKKQKLEFPRRQLSQTMAVKATSEGSFVSANPPLHNNDARASSSSKAKTPMYSHYKGPDENGHYISYALIFRGSEATDFESDAEPNIDALAINTNSTTESNSSQTERRVDETGSYVGEKKEAVQDRTAKIISHQEMDLQDFSVLYPYIENIGLGRYRVVMRLFEIQQSKRRVSTMIHRVESYIKKRRQSLLVKENSTPSWQGIVLLVCSIVGLLLTLLLGQFWDEKEGYHGLHKRRQRQQYMHEKRAVLGGRAGVPSGSIPPQYEVKTQPSAAAKRSVAGNVDRTATAPPPAAAPAKSATTTRRPAARSSWAGGAAGYR